MNFMDEARSRVRGRGLRIVYPEGLEERAMRAAVLLRDQDLARPVLVGSGPAVAARAATAAAGPTSSGRARSWSRRRAAARIARSSSPSA